MNYAFGSSDPHRWCGQPCAPDGGVWRAHGIEEVRLLRVFPHYAPTVQKVCRHFVLDQRSHRQATKIIRPSW